MWSKCKGVIKKMPMVSMQISEKMLKKFDSIQRESNFMNRSEALRDAIELFIKIYEDRKGIEGIRRSIINVIYQQDMDNLETISKIDHIYEDMIKTYSEYNLEKKTIRTYLAIGDSGRLNDFYELFNKIKNTQTKITFI